MKRKTIATGILLLTILSSQVLAEDVQKSSVRRQILDQVQKESITNSTTLPQVTSHSRLVATNDWSLNDRTYLCVVTQLLEQTNSLGNRRLEFYERAKDKLQLKYSFETGDWFLSVYPLKDVDGNLMTIWGGGSAYHIVIFSEIGEDVKIVLRTGSYFMPEIADVDNDGEYELIVSEGKNIISVDHKQIVLPESATVLKWVGKRYTRIWAGPWADRLKQHLAVGSGKTKRISGRDKTDEDVAK